MRVHGWMLVLLAATPPLAASPLPQVGQVQPTRPIECRCRANGQSYELGSRVCLSTPRGYRLAECRMQQNVTSWAIGGEDCSPTAGRDNGRTDSLALLTSP